MSDNLILYL